MFSTVRANASCMCTVLSVMGYSLTCVYVCHINGISVVCETTSKTVIVTIAAIQCKLIRFYLCAVFVPIRRPNT